MSRNPISKAARAAFNMKRNLPLTVNLMRDSRVDRLNKLVFLTVSLGYLVFPYDFIFDLPIFGQFDDLAVFLYMMNWFINRTPKNILLDYGWHEETEKEKAKREKKEAKKAAKTEAKKQQVMGFLKPFNK